VSEANGGGPRDALSGKVYARSQLCISRTGMLPLAPEDRRAFRRLWWSRTVRPFQYLALAGAAIVVASLGYLIYAQLTGTHSFSPAVTAAFLFMCVGIAVFTAGLALRERATKRVAIRPCPACKAQNLWLSAHCSKCGSALPPITVD